MSSADRGGQLEGPGIMLLGAVIFGYFGFAFAWTPTSHITGQHLFWVSLLEWTLKGAAVLFLLSAALTVARPRVGNLLYAVVGLVAAVLFVVVAVLDGLDRQHAAMPGLPFIPGPALLVLFAAWNGYGSWSTLRRLAGRGARAPS